MSVHDDTHWPKVVVCGNKSTHGARVSKRFTLTDTGLHILLLNSQKQLFDENVRRLTENLKAIAEKHTWFPFVFYGFAKYVSEPEDLEILQQVLSKFFEDHRSYFMFGHPNRDVSAFALFSRAVVDI
ncbi:MAG TPA: hypothetical protein VJZ68_04785, partial [Nitrososphaera sp.]|nr:hypothetical protein [Nitrososphaera sp.]